MRAPLQLLFLFTCVVLRKRERLQWSSQRYAYIITIEWMFDMKNALRDTYLNIESCNLMDVLMHIPKKRNSLLRVSRMLNTIKPLYTYTHVSLVNPKPSMSNILGLVELKLLANVLFNVFCISDLKMKFVILFLVVSAIVMSTLEVDSSSKFTLKHRNKVDHTILGTWNWCVNKRLFKKNNYYLEKHSAMEKIEVHITRRLICDYMPMRWYIIIFICHHCIVQ